MQLGMIGLGRMGGNMTIRLEQRGHDVKSYDPNNERAPRRRSPSCATSSTRRARSG